jgi:hypothetical protein
MEQQSTQPHTHSPSPAAPPQQQPQPGHASMPAQPQPPAVAMLLAQLLPAIAATQEALARLTPQQHQRVLAWMSFLEQQRQRVADAAGSSAPPAPGPPASAAASPVVAAPSTQPGAASGMRPFSLVSQQMLQQLRAAVYHTQRAAYHAHRLQQSQRQRLQAQRAQRQPPPSALAKADRPSVQARGPEAAAWPAGGALAAAESNACSETLGLEEGEEMAAEAMLEIARGVYHEEW